MEFSEREIVDLAAFFAKRFPSYEQRAALSEAAGLAGDAQLTGDARAVWTDVVRVAVEKGRLNDLVERAQQARPDDDNLREMAAVILGGRRWRGGRVGLTLAAVAVGLVLVLVWSPWSGRQAGDEDASGPAEPQAVAQAPVSSPEPQVPVVAEIEPAAVPAVIDGDAVEPVIEPVAVVAAPQPEPEPVAKSAPKPVPKPAPGAPLRCEGPDGEVVGYWYAGEDAPPKGSTYSVDGGINVRVDYPGHHNSYDARSALVCTLGHGWQLRIGHEPVLVPGGHYWVPLSPDDIVSR